MPWVDSAQQQLPYQSGSDTSHEAARAAASSAPSQRATLTAQYRRHAFAGVTDHEMSEATGLPINVICARRNELGAIKIGTRMGRHGVRVTAWALEDRR